MRDANGEDGRCAHRFVRFRPWPIKDRYRCRCGLVTRLYDGTDATMTRPVHKHMTVAVKGFNVDHIGRSVAQGEAQ